MIRALAISCVLVTGCALAHERGDHGSATCDGLSRPAHPLGVPHVHRASADPCPSMRGAIASSPACDVTSDPTCPMAACRVDGDCTEGTNGRCTHLHHGTAAQRQYCNYDECFGDGDCASGPCVCRDSVDSAAPNACANAGNCRVDADCGPGGFCSPSLVNAGFCACPVADLCTDAGDGTGCFVSIDGGPRMAVGCICGNVCAAPGFYCHTPCDECASDDDCTMGRCLYDEREARWACRLALCTSGP